MEETFTTEKVKILEMQANYLRYLASMYPSISSPNHSACSTPYSSLSPQRSSRDMNPYDSIPVKKAEKPFEQLLEEQLQQNPSFDSSRNSSLGALNSNNRFLKRGEGHLCSYTRSFSSNRLKSIRNKLIGRTNEKLNAEISQIHLLKKELEEKSEEIKREEKELTRRKKAEIEEIKKIRMEKTRNSPKKDEVEILKKTIQKLMENEKMKDLKHQEELKKLNVTIMKLRKTISEYEKNSKQPLAKTLTQAFTLKSIRPSPEKGKIQQYIEKKTQKKHTPTKDSEFTISHFPNKDVKKTFPDGKTIISYYESKITLTTLPNGVKIYNFPNGQTEKHLPSGDKEIIYPDGTIKTIFENGNEEILYPDGEVELVNKKIG